LSSLLFQHEYSPMSITYKVDVKNMCGYNNNRVIYSYKICVSLKSFNNLVLMLTVTKIIQSFLAFMAINSYAFSMTSSNGNMRSSLRMWPLAQYISKMYGNNGRGEIEENIKFTIYPQFSLFFRSFFYNHYGNCLWNSIVFRSWVHESRHAVV